MSSRGWSALLWWGASRPSLGCLVGSLGSGPLRWGVLLFCRGGGLRSLFCARWLLLGLLWWGASRRSLGRLVGLLGFGRLGSSPVLLACPLLPSSPALPSPALPSLASASLASACLAGLFAFLPSLLRPRARHILAHVYASLCRALSFTMDSMIDIAPLQIPLSVRLGWRWGDSLCECRPGGKERTFRRTHRFDHLCGGCW